MARDNWEQVLSLQTRQEQGLFLRIEQASLLEMSETEFQQLIVDVENSALFKRLHARDRLVRYQPFQRGELAPNFCDVNEQVTASPGSIDVESLVSDRQQLVQRIKELGPERFKRYFLYPEEGITVEEVARQCQLDVAAVHRINELIDKFSVASEFYHPSAIQDRTIHYSKVAAIRETVDGLVVNYFSPGYARGRFAIDYERFEDMLRSRAIDRMEAKEIRLLFRKLEFINRRKDTLHRVLQGIADKQALFLRSGDPKAMLPFTQRELAARIDVAASSVCRAVAARSIDTPWNERPLKDFFPSPKKFRKDLIKRLLEQQGNPISDRLLRIKLEQDFGVSISRRAVASLRKELRMPSSRQRTKILRIQEV